MPKALIIGSGVAGPAVGQLLRRTGWDVEVFEADPAPDGYAGLFLNVATNGLAVLDQLGLRTALLADAHAAPHLVMWSRTGKRLGEVPNGPAGDPGRGGVVVRRGWLHDVVREGARASGVTLTFGARLTGIDETPSGVRASFADGRVAEGDLLIGCDGISSFTRTWIDPAAPAPAYSGLVGLGGFAHVDGLPPTPATQHFVFGARSFFGYLVRDDGTVYWFANLSRPDPSLGSLHTVESAAWLAELRDLHRDDPFPVPQILERVEGALRGYPIHDLAHVPQWSRGRVVAVGDAVHAVSPSAGQGASLALEDAITLTRCLRDLPDHAEAFAEYQRRRQPRAEEVVRYARAIDAKKRVTTSRLGVAVRDALMPAFLRLAADSTRNDWLYNHTVDREDARTAANG